MIRSPEEALPEYDLCIVGSGPSGMTVATELSASGLKICVVESGGLKRSQFADALKKVEHTGFRIREESRERIVGDTSYTWAGQSAPLDPIDFEPRPHLPAYTGWSITNKDSTEF